MLFADLDPQSVKGFLSPEDGEILYRCGLTGAKAGPLLEVGAYCGRSSCYLGAAARDAGSRLFSIDHHAGSEEHQPGEAFHDPDLWDAEAGRVDTLPAFRRTIQKAGLDEHVEAVVGQSAVIARNWTTPLGLIFIDGGHSLKTALADWRGWAGHVAPGGLLLIHDVHPAPSEGGRPPMEIFARAVVSSLFEPVQRRDTLIVLRRVI